MSAEVSEHPNPEPRVPASRHLAVLAAFLLLAVFWTWPVAANLSSRIPHDAGDPVLNVWILWWNAHAVPLTETWWNPPMMWPMPGAMALSEHLLGLSAIATPLQWLGATPIAAYNTCLVLSYALSGFFAYLLIQRLTGSTMAGLCAGVAYGFSPYRASQLAHIQVLASQWMPLALLGLHSYVSSGRIAWLVVFAAAWLLQALSNGYYLLFFPALIAAWLAWFVDWRTGYRRGAAIVGAWVLGSLPLVPVLLKYLSIHSALGLRRTVPEMREFSAIPQSFLHAAPLMKLWPEGPALNYELYLFPGVTVVVLALLAVGVSLLQTRSNTRSSRHPILFYALAAIVMCALALGPGGAGNEPASMSHPYSWLLWLPGFDGIRVSSRFFMIATLCLAVAAGLGVARLEILAGRWRIALGTVALCALAADGLTEPVPILSPPGKVILPVSTNAAVIELPIDNTYVSVAAMYRSIFHGQPLANGYSGHFPPHYNILTLSLARGDVSGLLYLARRRPLAIIVNDLQDPGHEYRKMVEAIPGIQSHGVGAGGSTFVLPPQPEPRALPEGRALAATVRDSGRYQLEFDLGSVHDLTSLDITLGKRHPDLAPRIKIETSDDGQTWREDWVGWTGGLAIDAALRDPRIVPLRLPLAGSRGRYVRIYPASEWMRTDLMITER